MEINGIEYRIGTLDVFKQLHVSRRIAPLLAEAVKAASAGEPGNTEALFDMDLGPIAQAFARMTDEDVEYVVKTCLRVVKRIEEGEAMRVLNASDGIQYPDIQLMGSMQLVFGVLKENLGDFFSTGQSLLSPGKR